MILLVVKFYSNAMTTNLQKFVTSCLLLCVTTAMSLRVNAAVMHTSPESDVVAPDILGHQLVGLIFLYKTPPGTASQHMSPTLLPPRRSSLVTTVSAWCTVG